MEVLGPAVSKLWQWLIEGCPIRWSTHCRRFGVRRQRRRFGSLRTVGKEHPLVRPAQPKAKAPPLAAHSKWHRPISKITHYPNRGSIAVLFDIMGQAISS